MTAGLTQVAGSARAACLLSWLLVDSAASRRAVCMQTSAHVRCCRQACTVRCVVSHTHAFACSAHKRAQVRYSCCAPSAGWLSPCRSALWNAARPGAPPEAAAAAGGHWHARWGDRCQELVWIGVDMDEAALRGMLDACLLTDDEMALGPAAWLEQFEDALPPWDTGEGGEEHGWLEEEEEEGEEGKE